jgi:GT2 family glycosyltransferase
MDPNTLSIIVTAHRFGPMLQECLRGVSLLCPPPGEVIVAVDGSCPEIRKEVTRLGFDIMELVEAPGVSATRNAGAFKARGRLLAFMDSDVLPRPDFVTKAISALQTLPGAGAAFGSYDANPAAPGLVSRYRNLLHHFTHQNANREAGSFWAACGVCDAGVFREAGGFDESYRIPCIEDIALGYKLRRLGHRIALDPSWQVTHLKQWTWSDLVITDFSRRAVPWTLLLLEKGSLDNDLNIDHRSRWSAMMVVAAVMLLAFAWMSPWWLLISLTCLGVGIFLNFSFYRFLAAEKGVVFAALAVPLHLLYFLVATAGYVSGNVIFRSRDLLRFQA